MAECEIEVSEFDPDCYIGEIELIEYGVEYLGPFGGVLDNCRDLILCATAIESNKAELLISRPGCSELSIDSTSVECGVAKFALAAGELLSGDRNFVWAKIVLVEYDENSEVTNRCNLGAYRVSLCTSVSTVPPAEILGVVSGEVDDDSTNFCC